MTPKGFITELQIETFLDGHQPQVIVWGDRVFLHESVIPDQGQRLHQYEEAYALFVPTEQG